MADDQYNPLDKLNLGKSVAEALLDKAAEPLGDLSAFEGAGIYAIYYTGPFSPYAALSRRNADSVDWPIYIGKAIPSGGRRGSDPFSEITGRPLVSRLREHADSLRVAENLEIHDFQCRYLRVDDIWIPLGETLLISKFRPLWNVALDGFGNHDPGTGRYGGLRPLWDVLHPGRVWALRCRARSETPEELIERVTKYLAATEPPDSTMDFSAPRPP